MDTIGDYPVFRSAKSDQCLWLERVQEVCECPEGLILKQGVGLFAPVLRDQPAVFQQRSSGQGALFKIPNRGE